MEASNSDANHVVLHAQNDRRGLGPMVVLHAQNDGEFWDPWRLVILVLNHAVFHAQNDR